MTVVIAIFIVCLGLAVYTFLGYPLLMSIVANIKGRTRSHLAGRQGQSAKPQVEIIVAAYNEESIIASTLESLLAQNYPADIFTISVFSDGSTDKTEEIVRRFRKRGVELVIFEGRIGKTECQNRMVARSKADVVAFADGNLRWDPTALKELVLPMTDPTVAVTGGKLNLMNSAGTEQINEGLFRRFDHIIKVGETSIHSSIGVNGPIYAVRRSAYIKLRSHQVSDLVLPVLAAARGQRVLYVPKAIAWESASTSIWQESRRKRRLVTQGFVALPVLVKAFAPSRQPVLFFLLLSHKILRWIGIELLILAFIASLFLLPLTIFKVIVIAEFGLVVLAMLGLVLQGKLAIIQALSYFVVTNVAGFLGMIDYLRGRSATRWKTQRT